MRQNRHTPPKRSSTRPQRTPTERPPGVQHLKPKAWDRVRAIIRALREAPGAPAELGSAGAA